MVQTSLGSPVLPTPPLKPPSLSCLLQGPGPSLSPVCLHFRPLLRNLCPGRPAPSPDPAPLRAMARAGKASQLPLGEGRGRKGPAWGSLEVSTCPGHPLTGEACLRALPVSADEIRLSGVMCPKGGALPVRKRGCRAA